VDSSKQSMHLLTRNLEVNGLAGKTRLILEDVKKYMQREIKRGSKFDGILLDPPTFGRGPKGEIFKIETDVNELIDLCSQLTIPDRSFVVFTCHTPGLLPSTLQNLFFNIFNHPARAEELVLNDIAGRSLPAGIIAKINLDKSFKESKF
jgi:23S rRNA (cytosine1962-C5)-methyltransferase